MQPTIPFDPLDISLDEYKRGMGHNRAFGREVTGLVLKPFTNVGLMVFARMYAQGTRIDGTHGVKPFSCRLKIKASKSTWRNEQITLYDVTMPDRSDIDGEESPRFMSAEKYHELIHTKQLRSALTEVVNKLEYYGLVRLAEHVENFTL